MSDDQNNRAPIHLGVLDSWSHVSDTIAMAEEADRLGYARYWLTEHPPQPNPQMIAALVAGVTENLRVGTAGILLHFHVPLAAAQQFLLLEHVFPGRIDAGFCGGGAAPLLAEALLDGRTDPRRDPAAPEERAATLIGFLRGDLPAGHRYETIHAWPEATHAPKSGASARVCAVRSWPCATARRLDTRCFTTSARTRSPASMRIATASCPIVGGPSRW